MWKGCWFPCVVALMLDIFWKWCMAFPRVKKGWLLRLIYPWDYSLEAPENQSLSSLIHSFRNEVQFYVRFWWLMSCHQEFFGNNAIWFRLAGRNSDLQGLRLAGRIDWICVARWNYLKLPPAWPLLGDLRQKHHFGCFLKLEMKDDLFLNCCRFCQDFPKTKTLACFACVCVFLVHQGHGLTSHFFLLTFFFYNTLPQPERLNQKNRVGCDKCWILLIDSMNILKVTRMSDSGRASRREKPCLPLTQAASQFWSLSTQPNTKHQL